MGNRQSYPPCAYRHRRQIAFLFMSGKGEFGNLGERARRARHLAVKPVATGRHVDARVDGEWVPGLLASWERQPDGSWWGRVVLVRDGVAAEFLIAADRLRPPGSSSSAVQVPGV